MKLYHGSNTVGIEQLAPRQADHDQPYIYLSTLEIVAGFYLCNGAQRPWYWVPYGFDKEGRVVYDELYPNALRDVSQGRSGCIYTVVADESALLPLAGIPCARLSTRPLDVAEALSIADCYDWLMAQERAGAFRLCRYEEKTAKQLQWWHDALIRYIASKNMIEMPDCSYAQFLQRKLPHIWEEYVREHSRG